MRIRVKNIYIILFVIVVIILIFAYHAFIRFQAKNAYNYQDEEDNNSIVELIYEEHPDIFVFGEDGECIITVGDILKGKNKYEFDIMHDSEGNDCIGYYIIQRDIDKNIKIDASHICEMIDY